MFIRQLVPERARIMNALRYSETALVKKSAKRGEVTEWQGEQIIVENRIIIYDIYFNKKENVFFDTNLSPTKSGKL